MLIFKRAYVVIAVCLGERFSHVEVLNADIVHKFAHFDQCAELASGQGQQHLLTNLLWIVIPLYQTKIQPCLSWEHGEMFSFMNAR